MPDLGELVSHWGYLAIFLFVILGNLGLPVPEESILVLAGYLVWQGQLRLPLVLVVGILSAIAGDNLGYWVGRRYGQEAIERYGKRVLLTPARIEATRRLVTRYGGFGIFAARFIAGLRFMAGPLAGSAGVPPLTFMVANALGAMIYAPTMIAAGYAVGFGLGDSVKRFERVVGRVEHVVLAAAILLTAGLLGWRMLRAARAGRRA
ncbi:MAG: DedA family protein [Candidatus Methylomirabilales bacterium]